MTEPRARQLVTVTCGYVCDFIEGVLSAEGDLRAFEGTAAWLHQAEHWQLRGAARDDGGAAAPPPAVEGGSGGGSGSGGGRRGSGVQRQQRQQASM